MPISFPPYQLLVLEERLPEQEAEGVRMPEGIERGERALRILIETEKLAASPSWGIDRPSIEALASASARRPRGEAGSPGGGADTAPHGSSIRRTLCLEGPEFQRLTSPRRRPPIASSWT
jgi:hypothetical protein